MISDSSYWFRRVPIRSVMVAPLYANRSRSLPQAPLTTAIAYATYVYERCRVAFCMQIPGAVFFLDHFWITFGSLYILSLTYTLSIGLKHDTMRPEAEITRIEILYGSCNARNPDVPPCRWHGRAD